MGILARAESILFEKILADKLIFHLGVHAARSSRECPKPSDVRSVLIWNMDSPGDSLLITPLIRALRSGYSSAKITLLYNQSVASIFKNNPDIDEKIPVDPNLYYSAKGFLGFPNSLKGRNFDVVVVPEMGSRPADAARLWAARTDAYVVTGPLGLFRNLHHYTVKENSGESRRYWGSVFLEISNHLGIPFANPRPFLPLSAEDSETVDRKLGSRVEISLAIHPFVASYARKTKQWPVDRFSKLISAWLEKKDGTIVLTGSPDDRNVIERDIIGPLKESYKKNVRNLAGTFDFRETAELYRRSQKVLTQDTVALHIANSQSTPTLALFGATDPKCLAGPFPELRVLHSNIECHPCMKYRNTSPFWPECIYDSPRCLESLTVELVLKELELI